MNRNCASLLAASMLLCTLTAASAQESAQTARQAQPRPNVGDDIPHSWGGLPDNVPARPQVIQPTPLVHDIPPPRATKPMTSDQLLALQKELSAARARNQKLEDPNASRKASEASAANAAALEGARKKAGKPASNPASLPPKQ
jgi:hypothetical protein